MLVDMGPRLLIMLFVMAAAEEDVAICQSIGAIKIKSKLHCYSVFSNLLLPLGFGATGESFSE